MTVPSPAPTAVPGRPRSGPGVLSAAALAADAAEELVLATARDMHGAVVRRLHRLSGRDATRVGPGPVSWGVYAGIGAGLALTSRTLRAADRRGLGARLDASARGRAVVAAANGLLGDRLVDDLPELAITMSLRVDGRDVACEPEALAAAYPDATEQVVVFVHGLGESDDWWRRDAGRRGGSYADSLTAGGRWTPVMVRVNTGLPIGANGVALASLLDDLVGAWPARVRRIALVGHSMGGLIIRAACAVRRPRVRRSWTRMVTDVVTLGTPHLGAPLERGVHAGSRALGVLPESAPLARILEYRSVGILDLRDGLAPDVRHLPHARYRLVAATLTRSPRHPVAELLGDLLVRYPSAVGRPRRGRPLFPDADVLHVRGDHFSLLNHPEVDAALRGWLG